LRITKISDAAWAVFQNQARKHQDGHFDPYWLIWEEKGMYFREATKGEISILEKVDHELRQGKDKKKKDKKKKKTTYGG
jgi:hypothetical protein